MVHYTSLSNNVRDVDENIEAGYKDHQQKRGIRCDKHNQMTYQRDYIFPKWEGNNEHKLEDDFTDESENEKEEDGEEEMRRNERSCDRLLRLQDELRRTASISTETRRYDMENLKQRLQEHHESKMRRMNNTQQQQLSPVARVLTDVRRENSNRARNLFQKMSTKSFLYTMLVRHYIFRHDISKVHIVLLYSVA